MNDAHLSPSDSQALRTGIQQTYARYHAQDRDRFPDIDYNTSRANYEPLPASFEHELYVVRRVAPTSPAIHIPSTNTLMLLFTDDQYSPGPKILAACRLYAEQLPEAVSNEEPAHRLSRTTVFTQRGLLYWLLVGAVVAGSLLVYRSIRVDRKRVPGELVIRHPRPGQVVPRLLLAEGKATGADTVWLVVRPVTVPAQYYAQLPAPVEADGTWKCYVYIGTNDDRSVGYPFDIRAFVGPEDRYRIKSNTTDYMFDSWPENAALATEAVRVVRGKARY